MKRLLRYLLALAREIGDENAYERHLRVTGRCHSAVGVEGVLRSAARAAIPECEVLLM